VAGGVRIFYRVIIHPRIPIPRLGTLGGFRDYGIRLDEPSQRGIIPSCPVVVQSLRPAQGLLLALPWTACRAGAARPLPSVCPCSVRCRPPVRARSR
jgi:hypothetical protein